MASMIGGISGTAMGTVGTIFGAIAGMKADKKLSKLLEEDPTYKSSPYASERYGLAKTLLNSRMAGSAARERNIYGAGANQIANINRGATDASQALALAAGVQGQQGQQFEDMQQGEVQDYYNKMNNLVGAQQGMTDQHEKLFDDEVRRWQDKVNVNQAQYAMRQKGAQSFVNLGSMASSMGGGMGGSGGGGFSPASSGMGSMGSLSGGGNTLGGGISDKRLKRNYHIIGKSKSGINIYQFQYLWSDDIYVGAMAQENPQASFDMGNGFLAIDYNKIDVQFKKIS